MKIKTFTFLVGLLFCVQIFSQNIGDYRSVQSGKWEAIATWQVYTASGWVAATQYPGQNPPNSDTNATVIIQAGTTIEVPTTALTLSIKNVYVKGSLVLLGNLDLSSTTNFYVEKGVVLLDKAKQLILPNGAVLSMDIDNITSQGFQPIEKSDCNGNTAVVIGGTYYTACAGGGSGHTVVGDFAQLNTNATTIKSNPATNPNVTEACKGASFGLVGGYIYSGTGTAPTVSYKWQLVSAPSGYSFSTSTQQNTNTGALNYDGDYVFRLTVSAYNTNSYKDIKITVGKTVVFTTVWVGGLPNLNTNVVINGNYSTSVNGNFEACSCTINAGAKLTIDAFSYMKVQNGISSQGNLVVESDGSLIQVNSNAVNVGNITVKRKAKLKRNDYNYWGSPVSNQNLKAFSPETLDKRFYTYDEATDGFVTITPTTNNFIAGKGYAIRASATAPLSITDPLASKDYTFVGVPNNGNISYNLDKIGNGYNLVANPYPSNINLDKLYQDNVNDITGTFYFWTNINPNPAMQYANYPTAGYYNNYATYNASGGVPPAHPLVTDTNEINKITPEAVIKPGQGFIVKATGNLTTGDGKLNFNNSQRTEATNTKFLNARMANADNVSIDRYRLQLTTPLQLVNTVLVAYKEGSSLAYESSYDAKLLVESPDSFYTQLNQEKMIIQGRGYPMDISDVVQLGTTFYQPGEHTISLLTKEGIFAEGQPIYLKDKVTGQVINLQTQNYTFTVVDTNESSDRFEVAYVNSTLATDVIKNKEGITIYKDGTDFVISANEKLKEFKIYDASGKLMGQKSLAQKEYRFSAQDLKSGLYIIDVFTANQRVSKKVIK